MKRRVTIQTPLGDQLKFRQLQGSEEISQLFTLDVDLLSESKSIDPKALLGKNATIVVETEGGGTRYIDGIVTRFGMQGQDHRMYSYRARLSPWLWLATRKTDFKVFQNKTVPEIIEEVLGKYGYPLDKKLNRSYRTWDYCVQYNESDCQFVSRLMEHEGIYYYHQHSAGQHVLTLADDIVASHSPLPGAASIPFYPPEKAAIADRECVYAWELAEEIKSARHFNDDYDFKKPRADLSNMRKDPPGHAHDSYEVYEWPGGYTEYADGETYVKVRLQENLTRQSAVQGKSSCRALAPGYTFNLENYPRGDQNQQYLITAVQYHFQENPEVSSVAKPTPKTTKEEVGSIQRFVLKAQPTSLPFTPPRVTPKPRSLGPQTAVVVGPPGEEIWTDKYGRVKVQFHWDRIGAMDDQSSCWIRVSTSWAGPQFGAVFIPRIGMEVIIDFLNGDPDYPILTGCVYNAVNMPPWALPANATQSGILTRSSKGGASGPGLKNGQGDANALRFEDKAGQEQLWIHAQKDQLTEVENDEDKWVGNDRRKTIDRDETNHIKRDRTETVDRNEKITVHGWRTEEVDGDETITIHSNRTERVDHNEKISIGDNRNEDVGIDESISIGKNRSKTVGKNEKDKIGSNWSIKVGKFKTETIALASLQNVGLGKIVNIGAAYNLNVGGLMATVVGAQRTDSTVLNHGVTVGKHYKLTAGESITLQVGQSVLVMRKDGSIALNGQEIDLVGGKHIGMDAKRIDLN